MTAPTELAKQVLDSAAQHRAFCPQSRYPDSQIPHTVTYSCNQPAALSPSLRLPIGYNQEGESGLLLASRCTLCMQYCTIRICYLFISPG